MTMNETVSGGWVSPLAEVSDAPLIRLGTFGELDCYAKPGYMYPTGSIKYRVAGRMIDKAEDAGELSGGVTILERSSGNTGIALVYEGRRRGYTVKIFTGNDVTSDAKRMMREHGGEVVEVDGYFDACGNAIRELMERAPELYYWPDQISNPVSLKSNIDLGNEIAIELTPDIFIASAGTGSTITGVGSALKNANPDLQIYLVTPQSHFDVPGIDDISTYHAPLFCIDLIDEKIAVSQSDAIAAAKLTYEAFGHPVGISAGAVLAAARKIGRKHGGKAVLIFADHRNRYTHLLGE